MNVHVLPKAVDPELIRTLELALEQAKAGEISAILLLTQDRTGIDFATVGIENRWLVSGWLQQALYKLHSTGER